jgi:hypothetical protein
MPKIGIQEKPYYNTDPIANALAPDDIFNCYLEAIPNLGYSIRRRPGLTQFADVGSGVACDGIFEWDIPLLEELKIVADKNRRTLANEILFRLDSQQENQC